MRNETESNTKQAISKEQMVDSTKLVSLLALAAGAVAMPETGNASVVYTNLANPVTVTYNNPSFAIALPGTARLGFQEFRSGLPSALSYHRLLYASQAGGYVRLKTHMLFAVHVHLNNPTSQVVWSQIPASDAARGLLGKASAASSDPPNGYDHDYLPFKFKDSTHGNLVLYGWVDISFSNSDLSTGQGPAVTIWRYAYDDSGNQIFMGQTTVPEPASMSLMALGAMALGARGVRAWRRKKGSDQ